MNFSNLLDQTRTYHNFEKTDLEIGFIESLILDSLKAPNHKFTFPWQYFLVRGKNKDLLADFFLDSKKDSLDEELGRNEAFFRNKILNPEIIILAQKLAPHEFTRKEDYATIACSVQLMALNLRESGYGYKWSTGGLTRYEKVYNLLGLDQSNVEIIGFLFIGKSKSIPAPRRRPGLEEVFKIL